MPNQQKVNEAIDGVIAALNNLKRTISEEVLSVQSTSVPATAPTATVTQPQASVTSDDFDSFESLKRALATDKWPDAVNANLICHPDNESDKLERGRGIVELMIEEDLKGLKFLDFGCGEGHCPYVVTDYNPAISVGYDIKEYESWNRYTKDNLVLTTDFQKVIDNGPYNVIVLFDVIDHLNGTDPIDVLSKAQSVLAPDGRIYMRCHPYTSRHATHLYHELNKAYAHLVFSPTELATIVPNPKWSEKNAGVIFPIKTYGDLIDKANLNVVVRKDITEKVEPFFKIPKIAERIMKTTGTSSFPEFQLSLQFLDYILKSK